MFKEFVFKCLVPNIVACSFKEGRVFCVIFSHSFHLFIVIGTGQSCQTIWVQFTTAWVKFCTIIFRKFCSKGIYGDDYGTTVSFKLKY